MAGTKEIKTHIDSVQETRKITNAMYLIASTKLRRAREELDNTRPYFNALQREIKRIFRKVSDVESPYFYPVGDDSPLKGTYGCLVITADKGLAGAYNQNVLKEVQRMLGEHRSDNQFFVVGEYGRQYFAARNIPIEKNFLYTAQSPTLQRARNITALLLDRFRKGELSHLYGPGRDGVAGQDGAAAALPPVPVRLLHTGEEGGYSLRIFPQRGGGTGQHDPQLCVRIHLQRPGGQLLQ